MIDTPLRVCVVLYIKKKAMTLNIKLCDLKCALLINFLNVLN